MAFTRVAALLHSALSDVSANQHHTPTIASELDHQDLSNRGVDDHHTQAHNLDTHAVRNHVNLQNVTTTNHAGAATQAEMEAESAVTRMFRVDRTRFAPGVAKAACHIASDGTLDSPSYNVASVTDTGVGDRTIVWDDDFSSVIYFPVTQQTEETTTFLGAHCMQQSLAVGSMVMQLSLPDGSGAPDTSTGTIVLGDQ